MTTLKRPALSAISLEIGVFEQQIFEETTNGFRGMANLGLEYPQIWRRANRHRGECPVVIGAVRKLRKPMAGEFHIQHPAEVARGLVGKVIKFFAGHAGLKPLISDRMEDLLGVLRAPSQVGVGILPDNKGFAAIALGITPYGSDVDEEDIVAAQANAALGRILKILDRVGSKADENLVPSLI